MGKKRLLIVIDHFESGGAARVTSIMVNGLYSLGYDVYCAFDYQERSVFYEVNNNVHKMLLRKPRFHNGKISSILIYLFQIKQIRRYIDDIKPDVVIGVLPMQFMFSFFANLGLKRPIVAVDHTSFSRKTRKLITWIRFRLYKKADIVSILTQRDAKILGDKIPNKVVVYNPLPFSLLAEKTERRKTVLCAGRLDDWNVKGFDRMIDIWSRIAIKQTDWNLEIAGPGSEKARGYIKKLIKEKQIEHRVKLLGNVNDMKTLLSETSIFALPSRIEGFPMVLLEAMSQGCAPVTFSFDGAACEMLTNNKSGYIINDDDIDGFACSLKNLMCNPEIRNTFSSNAILDASRFSVSRFVDTWDGIINML